MPMKLIIEEEEVIENSIADLFEAGVSEDASVINIKWNVLTSDEDEVLGKIIVNFPASDIFRYLEFCNVKIKYSSAGFHLLGDSKIPHVHLNLIVDSYTPDKNPSQHRTRWFQKSGTSEHFKSLTFKYNKKIEMDSPKYSTLAYPLKEGHSLFECLPFLYKNISVQQHKFLLDVGTSIYNRECGLHLRQAKCEERKKNALLELNSLCEKHKYEFYDYETMLLWLDVNYISTLTITELPDPKHYKTNLQKIAVKLGYLTYSQLCL